MELMSSLLLFALVALLPHVFGKSNMKLSYNIGFNESMIIRRKPSLGKNIMVNVNSPSAMGKVSDLQSVFMDPTCKGCFKCMERAIKAHKVHSRLIMDSHTSADALQGSLTNLDEARRNKRKVNNDDNAKKSKKSKPKKNKTVTVFKYVEDEKIYALKIKESNVQSDPQNSTKADTTCQIYSVKKSLPCESTEANTILKTSKRKISKRSKKDQTKKETSVTPKTTHSTPFFKKRQIDDSSIPDQYMPSIEEMY